MWAGLKKLNPEVLLVSRKYNYKKSQISKHYIWAKNSDRTIQMMWLGVTNHTFYKYIVKCILLREICVNHSGIAPTPNWNLTLWLWIKMMTQQQKYFPCCTTYVPSDLYLLFSLKNWGLVIEKIPCKHWKKAKADISHLLLLTKMGKTVLMYYWVCCI